MVKLRMKFSALSVDFDGPSLHFLGSRKPAHEGIKERYPVMLILGLGLKRFGLGQIIKATGPTAKVSLDY